jgi:hypothetical protein
MMHPDAELRFIRDNMGYGLFARKRIPRGTITWTRDELDQQFSQAAVARMDAICRERVFYFGYVDREGNHILCWDHGRFMNHSCDPNCLSAGFDFEFAVRDIEPGEQLCDDYGLLNLIEELECQCGSPRCRGVIRPDDIAGYGLEWDVRVQTAFPFIGQAPQPLWPLVGCKEQIEAGIRGELAIPSCRLHAFGSSKVC